jgi:membrane protein
MAQATATRHFQPWSLLRDAAREWFSNKTFTMGAALAYYAVFSLAPLLLISISTAGLIFGEEAARGELVQQMEAVTGPTVARAVEDTLRYAHVTGSGTLAVVIGFVVILVSSTGLFGQLQDSLNTIWHVQTRPGRGWGEMLKDRLMPFLMVLLSGALLMGMLLLNSLLSALDRFLPREFIPGAATAWLALDWAVTLALATVVIALVYKVLPDVSLRWKDVWVGAAVTALLLLVGNWAIGLYLRWSGLATVYGAAGSVVVVLLWVYYSSQVFLFGAELTHTYATRDGSARSPRRNAQPCPLAAGGRAWAT